MEFVPKPWGFEYRIEVSENVALTFLVIKGSKETSLHCHPVKTTSMVCLGGLGKIKFFNSSFELTPGEGFTIRNGLFHQIVNINPSEDLELLEFENPPNRFDLIRFSDSYGRESQPYEESKDEEGVSVGAGVRKLIKDGVGTLEIGNVGITVKGITRENRFADIGNCNYVVLSGGVEDTNSAQLVLRPADFVREDTLRRLIERFEVRGPFQVLEIQKRGQSDK